MSRIWADGRLIRDVEGQQSVFFSLRLHPGDEDQQNDPLIASTMGASLTPAFRGLAYLVFENFDLSTFGNRLPLITVEISDGSEQMTPESLLADRLALSRAPGKDGQDLVGVALLGDDLGTALEPFFEAFSPRFGYGQQGWTLERSSAHHVIGNELWVLSGDDTRPAQRLAGGSGEPTRVSVRYFDPDLDFAAGEKSARLPGQEQLMRIELPAAVDGAVMKAAALKQLAMRHDRPRQSWIDLPVSFAHINPGDSVSSEAAPQDRLVVSEKRLTSGGLRLRLRNLEVPAEDQAADEAGIKRTGLLSIEKMSVALVELTGEQMNPAPRIVVAVRGGASPFSPVPVSIKTAGSERTVSSASLPTASGALLEELPSAASELIDKRSRVHVLFETDPILTSCEEDALLAGANLIWIEGELLQFATAQALGGGAYTLSDLIRGRFGSERTTPHQAGSTVLIVDGARLSNVPLEGVPIGSTIIAEVHGPDGSQATTTVELQGLASKPWPPVHLMLAESQEGLSMEWVRRCKEGASWLDYVDAPLGFSREAYGVKLQGAGGKAIERATSAPSCQIDWQTLDALGSRPWRLEIRQIGDLVASEPLQQLIR